jgi:hypothetical protein
VACGIAAVAGDGVTIVTLLTRLKDTVTAYGTDLAVRVAAVARHVVAIIALLTIVGREDAISTDTSTFLVVQITHPLKIQCGWADTITVAQRDLRISSR